MARFLTSQWASAVTTALARLPAGAGAAPRPPGASGDTFTVAQLIHDVPADLPSRDGLVATVLRVEDGRASLSVHPGSSSPEKDVGPQDVASTADAVLSISYPDAVSLGRGDLDPAAALAQGRVRARGDLSLLVAGQELMTAAGARLHAVQAATTY